VSFFKWGSLIGTSSANMNDGIFSAGDIVWTPDSYNAKSLLDAMGTQTGEPVWNMIPHGDDLNDRVTTPVFPENKPANAALGIGDPCGYADGADGNSGWIMPVIENGGWNGGTFGSGRDSLQWEEAGAVIVERDELKPGLPLGGYPADGWSMFLPWANMRNAYGKLNTPTRGLYWTSTPRTGATSSTLLMTSEHIIPDYVWAYEAALAVRCVKAPEPILDVQPVGGDIPYKGGTKDYTVTSTLADGTTPAAWVVEYPDGNGGWTTEKPEELDWLTFSAKTGSGGEPDTLTAKAKVMPSRSNNEWDIELGRRALIGAAPDGTLGVRFNLASAGGGDTEATANAYIVNAPGYYKIPLYYGNTFQSYGALKDNFVNHDGIAISAVSSDGSIAGADNAALVWQDAPGMVENIGYDRTGEGFLTFEISKDNIRQGNAVVAIRQGTTVLWSWHIWVTPLVERVGLEVNEVENRQVTLGNYVSIPHKVEAYRGKINYFMQWNLGWVTARTISYGIGANYDQLRSVEVRVRQTGVSNPKTVPFSVTQYAGEVTTGGNNPSWQWGRKDAMPPSDGINETERTDLEWGSDFTWTPSDQAGDGLTGLADGVKNPNKYYTGSSGNWHSGTVYRNLWDAGNTTYGVPTLLENNITKTVYDPNPVGWKMPPSNAWTGFIKTDYGTWSSTTLQSAYWYSSIVAQFNKHGNWNSNKPGWNFYKALDGTGTTETDYVFYPASGSRFGPSGALNSVGSNGYGYYWSALPHNTTNGYGLRFHSGNVSPANGSIRSSGFSVRPIAENVEE
jgi:hypothetical protein